MFAVRAFVLGGIVAMLLLAPIAGAHASQFKVLYSFTGGSDGGNPGAGSLIMDMSGNIYGSALEGTGTVYRLTSKGSETTLYTFSEGSGGFEPEGLIVDDSGDLWGPALSGGDDGGCGVIFKISSKGKESVVHTFSGPPKDGCSPSGELITDSSGNFFGPTAGGGKNRGGSVFMLAHDGVESLIHSFSPKHGGFNPLGGLIMDANDNLYGVDAQGGRSKSGAVFKVTKEGLEAIVYAFKGSPGDGAEPGSSLLRDREGNLYGTTFGGGSRGCQSDSGCGVVFQIAPTGAETVLHFFDAKHGDGGNPTAGLIADSTGNLYGTTEYGGGNCGLTVYGCGTVFEITRGGTETVLYSFGKGSKGANPTAGLLSDAKGNLYGTASEGGIYGYGSVFELIR